MFQQKAAFTAYSRLLGLQAGTQLCTWFFSPSEKGNDHDVATIRGYIDFRRNRPNAPWLLEWAYFTDDNDVPKNFVKVEPPEIVPDGRNYPAEVPFYHSFCSKPLPNIVSSRELEEHVVYELEEAPIGNTKVITCLTAQIARNVF